LTHNYNVNTTVYAPLDMNLMLFIHAGII